MKTRTQKVIITLITQIMSYKEKKEAIITYEGVVLCDGNFLGIDYTDASLEVLDIFEERKESGEVLESEQEFLLKILMRFN